jgi:hypothetical protein
MGKILSTIIVGGSLALCQSAAATDYCVQPNTTCGGTQVGTLEDALSAAATATDADRIFLGDHTYEAPTTGGYSYQAPGSLELIGAGAGQTVLTGPTGGTSVLYVKGSPVNSLRDLTVRLPASVPSGSMGLETSGTATRIAVTEAPGQFEPRTGVFLDDGTLEDSRVTIGTDQTTTGVIFMSTGGTVRDSAISARLAVVSGHGGLIERSRLAGLDDGVFAGIGATTIKSTLISVDGPSAVGIQAYAATAGWSTGVDIDGVTVLGPSTVNSSGVSSQSSGAADVAVVVRNSIFRGFGVPLRADSTTGLGNAKISASYSDYDTSANHVGIAKSTIDESNITFAGNPGFASVVNGVYRLLAASPLVDAGDPAAIDGLDLDRNPLLADGTGDGNARRDIGAFEFQPATPAATPVDPAIVADPTPIVPSVAVAVTDKQAPLISRFRLRSKRFRYSLSEAARVTIKLRRVGARRVLGRLVRDGKVGSNTIKFRGRIGRRALPRGRYRAEITALDRAGNRSTARRLTFRVVR